MNEEKTKKQKQKLLEAYIERSVTRGKLLNSTEIDNSHKLTSFTVYTRYFGSIEKLKRATGLADNQKIKELMCKDCMKDPDNCNKSRKVCYKECDEFYLEVLRGNKTMRGQ